MCGIAGFVSARDSVEDRLAAVDRMVAAMRHRGPDDVGTRCAGSATLGMRRLAIFDPANGHQPMITRDGRFQLVFNGAIYNFRQLRDELRAESGATFNTECDTEVLLAAYAHWGEKCLSRLRGMYAFAVWDDRDRTLFLARDPFGIKPLYYAQEGQRLLFASELNALLRSGYFRPEIEPRALSASLAYLAVPAPRTIYRGLYSLRPAERAIFRDGQINLRTYWRFGDNTGSGDGAPHQPARSRGEFTAELRRRLEDTIQAHSLSDVPVGAFLSGGLDSSAIVGLMQRQGATKLRTFCIGFEETAFSEAADAEATARFLGTEHQTCVLTGDRVAGDLDRFLGSLDQPTADAINTFYVSETARQGGVTVALSGLGGDELFGGYPWFRTTPRLAQWLPWYRMLPQKLQDRFQARLENGDAREQKLADFLRHGRDLHGLAALQRRNLAESARESLLSGDIPFEPHDELARLPLELAKAKPFEVVSAWEMRAYMADVLLRDSDVMSMRHSLELRVPFVDRHFVEWLWAQPTRFKAGGGAPKAALAAAVRDLLPAALLKRRKRGFTLPFALWMRGPLRPFLQDTFSSSSLSKSSFFNTTAVQARWKTFLEGEDSREWTRIWGLAMAISFVNRRNPGPA